MKLAIMQPYFFPYIGYFQLIGAVDKFVIYDDGRYRKYGWINRNRILLDGRDHMFTVPLVHSSYHRLIRDTRIRRELYGVFKAKFARQLRQGYAKAPFFAAVFELIRAVLDSEDESISLLAGNSLKAVCRYLGIGTAFVESSTIYQNSHLLAQDRILDICSKEGAGVYISPQGSMELYKRSAFAGHGAVLFFLKPKPLVYRQFDNEFVPWLSIIDVLMFNPVKDVRAILHMYELV